MYLFEYLKDDLWLEVGSELVDEFGEEVIDNIRNDSWLESVLEEEKDNVITTFSGALEDAINNISVMTRDRIREKLLEGL